MLIRVRSPFARSAWFGLMLIVLAVLLEPLQLKVNTAHIADEQKAYGNQPAHLDRIQDPLAFQRESSALPTESPAAKHSLRVSDPITRSESGDTETVESAASKARIHEVIATGYYAGIESTGKSPGHPEYGITYSGVQVRRGALSTIAADPDVFPIGTIMYIPDYGYAVVADTGGAVKGNVIDLYFRSKEEIYREWGKRTVNVIVIEEGDGQLNEAKFHELERLYKERLPPPALL